MTRLNEWVNPDPNDPQRPLHCEVLADFLKTDPLLMNWVKGGITLGQIRPRQQVDDMFVTGLPLTAKVREHGRMGQIGKPYLHDVTLSVYLAASYEGDEEMPVTMGLAARRIVWLVEGQTIKSSDIASLQDRPVLSLPGVVFVGQQYLDAERIDAPEEVLEIEFTTGGEAGI